MLLRIILNSGAWAAIQLGFVFIANRIPAQRLIVRPRNWERNGRVYHWLAVRWWKNQLPDAGGWFANGFSKRKLRNRSKPELNRFAREARRGELAHWCAIGALPLFALWNTRVGMLINATYAAVANLPCIIAQRYNCARLASIVRPPHRKHAEDGCEEAVQLRLLLLRKRFKDMKQKQAPWNKSAPKGSRHHKLSSRSKSKAKAAAKRAGRPYPNLVDNMNAANKQRRKKK